MQSYKAPKNNIDEDLDALGYGDAFLNTTLKISFMKKIIDKLDFIKIKNFCLVQDNIQRIRRQATGWEKTFSKHTADKGLLPKIYKELLKLNSK